MADPTPAPRSNQLEDGTVTYDGVRTVITPEAPRHYAVAVSEDGTEIATHAVERVVINAATAHLESSVWFADVSLDVGVPIGKHGDTAWVWV